MQLMLNYSHTGGRKGENMEEKGFNAFDTTADIGLQIHGESIEKLFNNALKGLFSLITDIETIKGNEKVPVEVQGEDWTDLLVSWLNELIFLQDARGWLFRECKVKEIYPSKIEALCIGERFTPERHQIRRNVKAATYHQAQVKRGGEKWIARVILDI